MFNKINDMECAKLLSLHLSLIDDMEDSEKLVASLRSEIQELNSLLDQNKKYSERLADETQALQKNLSDYIQENKEQKINLEQALIANEEKDKLITYLRSRNAFLLSEVNEHKKQELKPEHSSIIRELELIDDLDKAEKPAAKLVSDHLELTTKYSIAVSQLQRALEAVDLYLKDVRRVDYIEKQLVFGAPKIDSVLNITFASNLKSGTVRNQLDAYMVSNAQA